jgi:hypothetical protein
MAICTLRTVGQLEAGFVLAPERYDPRRSLTAGASTGKRVSDIATLSRSVLSAQSAPAQGSFVILDTSDAREGILSWRKPAIPAREIGSTKKPLQPGDVIISRLRPYLRQVAFCDVPSGETQFACSTEFFVLRSKDGASIAFLVPFLLSRQVQSVLAASQEGGHHPRFNEETLLNLPVEARLLRRRKDVSLRIEKSVRLYREAEQLLAQQIEQLERQDNPSRPSVTSRTLGIRKRYRKASAK